MNDTPQTWPATAEDTLIERVRVRLFGAIAQDQAQRLRTIRADHGSWVKLAEGVERKVLSIDGAAQCGLVRLAPGASIPAHAHPIDEECMVLEGSVRIGPDLVLQAGDFHVARAGSAHDVTTTETGALVYLRSALEPTSS